VAQHQEAAAAAAAEGRVYLPHLGISIPEEYREFDWWNHGGLYRREPKMVSLKKWYGSAINGERG
jgi:hypothetical protein